MADRTVNVRLNLNTSEFRRGSAQAEQDSRRIATAATAAADQTERAFNSAFRETSAAATAAQRAQQAAFERAAAAAVSAGRVTAEASQAAAAATQRVAASAADIPATFGAAGSSASRALGEVSAAAAGASQSLARTDAAAVELSAEGSAALGRLGAAARAAMGEVTASAQPAAAATERVGLAAADVPPTFRAAGATASRALGEISTSALGASQALARTGAAAVNLSGEASAALGRLGAASRAAMAEAATSAGSAAAATRGVATAAAEIPATFAAAGTAASAALAQVAAASTRSSLAFAQASTAITASTVAAATSALRVSQRATMAASELTGTLAGSAGAATSAVAQITAVSTRSSMALAQVAAASTVTITASASALTFASRSAIAEAAAAVGVVTAEATAAQATLLGRSRAATTAWAASMRAQAAATAASMVASAETSEAAWRAVRMGGIALLAVFAGAVVAAARFEQAMSVVGAASGATGKDLDALRKSALEAGKATVFSAREAAEAEVELARAGIATADIVGGALRGALDLAASGQLGLSESAVIAAQAMNAFNLRGAQVGHIADVISAGAGKSATNVHDMGFAFRMSALVAQQTGLTLEDTVGVLSLFAQNALTGSDAGTSFKVMLQRLTPQSAESAAMMQQVGLSAYNAQGQFVGITELARRMATAFGDLTPEARNAALGVIFGSDAVRAASILYKAGEQQVRGWIGAVNDEGFATRTAAQQTNNLIGDLERLKGTLETALIESGSGANSVLRDMVKGITSVIDAYSSLPGPLKEAVTGVAGITGILAVAVGSFVLALPRIAAFRTALVELAVTMPRLAAVASATTATLFGPWGLAIGGAVAAMALFSGSHKRAVIDVEGLSAAVKQDSGIIGENTRAYAVNGLQKSGAMAAAKELGVSLKDLTDAALGSGDAWKAVQAQIAAGSGEIFGGGKRVDDYTKKLDLLKSSVDQTKGAVADAATALAQEGEASGKAAVGTKTLGDEAEATSGDLKKEETAADQLKKALDGLNGTNISVAQSAIAFQSDLQGLRDAVKENGVQLDISTEKGRAVKSAVLGAAEAAMSHAKAVAEQTGQVEAGTIAFGRDVEALKATMRQAGFTQEQIDQLTISYATLPPVKETRVTDPGAIQTITDLEVLRDKLAAVPPGKSITVNAPTADAIQDLKTIGYAVEKLPDGKVKVTVPPGDAFDGTTRIQQAINGIRGRAVAVDVVANFPAGLHRAGDRPNEQAAGSVIRYAAGGVRAAADGLSAREAMVSRRPILWAEAGPEAYIPLSPGRRERSMRLLGEVAGVFGQQLIPATPQARDLIPARSLAAPPAPAPAGRTGRGDTTIILQGARQTGAEQLADLQRHLEHIG
ncbi:phage tail tape measure protein [Kitasatospora sp. NPDC057692]|uniref:phage tail tape measure protein n=1 Tax=Kitasatospora sp. NPDC057692 TaxID=3346215 RepID=UPI0036A0799C